MSGGVPLRVVHAGKFYPPERGGMETVLGLLCAGTATRWRVGAVVANVRARTERSEVDGVNVVRAACVGYLGALPVCPRLPLELWRARYDCLVLHEPNPLAVLALFLRKPMRSFVLWHHADFLRPSWARASYTWMLRSLVRHAACVVVSNPVLAAADYLRVAKRVEVIPYGIPVEDFVASEVGARARASAIRERHGTPVVLFVGRLVYYKGVDVLLRAMASCPGTLLLVGEGPEESALRALSRRLGIEDRVKFLGHVSAEALTHHLYAADVFVLPSTHRTEAFGVVQLEAMACGVPVVSTDLPTGVPWVNQHGITGLVVPPNDEKALAEALRALLGDPALRHSLGQAGRRRATADFTQERMVAAFVRLIEDICEPV